jgi:hypothetical protein
MQPKVPWGFSFSLWLPRPCRSTFSLNKACGNYPHSRMARRPLQTFHPLYQTFCCFLSARTEPLPCTWLSIEPVKSDTATWPSEHDRVSVHQVLQPLTEMSAWCHSWIEATPKCVVTMLTRCSCCELVFSRLWDHLPLSTVLMFVLM